MENETLTRIDQEVLNLASVKLLTGSSIQNSKQRFQIPMSTLPWSNHAPYLLLLASEKSLVATIRLLNPSLRPSLPHLERPRQYAACGSRNQEKGRSCTLAQAQMLIPACNHASTSTKQSPPTVYQCHGLSDRHEKMAGYLCILASFVGPQCPQMVAASSVGG